MIEVPENRNLYMSQVGHYNQVNNMKFVLIFDVPFGEGAAKRQTHRLLIRAGAKMLQQSVWKHDELGKLMNVATFVKKSGGDARILEERFVF